MFHSLSCWAVDARGGYPKHEAMKWACNSPQQVISPYLHSTSAQFAAPRYGLSCAGGTGGQCAPFDGQPGKSSSGAVRARSRAAHSVPHDERAEASLIQAASAGAVPRTMLSYGLI